MVISLATLTITDAVLARWLLSNPIPYAIAERDKSIAVRCPDLSIDQLILWPIIHGATNRDKDGVPAIDSTQRYRRSTMPPQYRLPPPSKD